MRTLAIDYGTRRIGLAVSDPDETIAQPLQTLEAKGRRQAVEAIAALGRSMGVERMVVGLPLNMDGTEGPAAHAARRFAADLGHALPGLAVETFDERLTTVAAEEHLAAAGVRGKKRRAIVDRVAAAILLQTYLGEKKR